MGRVVNRRNALIGWAMWKLWRRRASRKAAKVGVVFGDDASRGRRRLVKVLGAVVAALGLVAVWRKLRGGGEDEWMTPEPLDLSGPEDIAPLSSVTPDDDVPPAA
jgi:hypothetical protein